MPIITLPPLLFANATKVSITESEKLLLNSVKLSPCIDQFIANGARYILDFTNQNRFKNTNKAVTETVYKFKIALASSEHHCQIKFTYSTPFQSNITSQHIKQAKKHTLSPFALLIRLKRADCRSGWQIIQTISSIILKKEADRH